MNFDFFETAKDHIIVVAHRGIMGGNIPCNTLTAYKTAIKQGADMIEIDVDKSADGTLYIFHPNMERAHLNKDCNIQKMSDSEIKKLRYVNFDNEATQFGINTLDEVLEEFKGKCYINVDKFWDNPKEISDVIKKHNMEEQILVKSAFSENVIKVLEEVAPTLPFVPVVSHTHPYHSLLMKSNVNYIGAEVLFKKDDEEVASDSFINMMHRDNKLLWVNSIVYSYRAVLAGGHSDDTALCESEEKGWGWLADRGFDFIQTDWPMMLVDYLKKSGKYNR